MNLRMKLWGTLLFAVLLIQHVGATNRTDSILLRIQNAEPEQKLDIWTDWRFSASGEELLEIWANSDRAMADAILSLTREEADIWHYKFIGGVMLRLQAAGFGEVSTTILDKMKVRVDSLTAENGGSHILQAEYYYYLAYFHYRQVDMDEAAALFKKGLEISANFNNHDLSFSFNNMLGLLYTFIDEHEEALIYYDQAGEIAANSSISYKQKLSLDKSRAYLFHAVREYEKADSLYKIVLDSVHLLSRETMQLRTKMDYAVNMAYLGKTEQGLSLLNKLRPVIEAKEDDGMLLVLAESYSDVYFLSGRYEEGAEWLGDSRNYYYKIQEERRKDEVQEWQAKYQSAEKEATIMELQQARTIERDRTIIAVLIALVLIGILGFFLYANRSRRKRLALQLENEKEISNTRSKFFASIAHDIRTPLALMLGPLERLESQVENESDKADVQLARRNGIRLMDLFNQILDWNKADAKLLKENAQVGRLDTSFKSISQRFEQLAQDKGINFKPTIDVPGSQFILDYGKTDRIVSNLLTNAIKYCDPGDEVSLHVQVVQTDGNSQLTIEVNDSGPGMAEAEQQQVYKRYFQGAQGKLKGGSGIGLALVKELVGVLGGRISMDSKLDVGTKFELILPVKVAVLTEWNAENLAFDEAKTEDKATILIVEDEPELATFVASELSKRFRVLTAGTAELGLELAKQEIPDLIISDWMLPDYNGGELCRKLVDDELTSHIPIIVLTAFNTEEHRKEALDAGAVVWMSKPFPLNDLNRQVDALLQQQQRSKLKWESVITNLFAAEPAKEVEVEEQVDPFIAKVQKTIQENYADENFSIDRMAETLTVSRVQLFRKVKNSIGNTPGKLLNEFRLQKAQQLLRSSANSVSETCFQVGFSDPGYFSKLYKQRFGLSPSQEVNPG
ncbi:hypothetical protein CEQ90_17370 [Lewinellaceae bacterium SD302]|nr:hypothetical protein CEQ90_17370 [Lewinellaceae bacterium SD302]